jgi:hypothetical protein
MLAPVTFAAVNRWLLDWLDYQPDDTPLLLLTLAAFVFEVGLMSWLCGRWLDDGRWTWGLYAWSWLLVDLHVLTASGLTGQTWLGRLVPPALFAAQVGLAMIWAVLGTTTWMIRLPVCLVLGLLLAWPLQVGRGFGRELVAPQIIALGLVCLTMRWRGFRIERVAARHPIHFGPAQSKDRLHTTQFGIRHVLYWTTALAIALAVLRALDMLSLGALANLVPRFHWGMIELLSAGLVIACMYVIAVWASLGSGPLWQRVLLLAVTLAAVGMALAVFDYRDYCRLYSLAARMPFWDFVEWRDMWCIYWAAFAGSLLFAALILPRVLGYRLVQVPMRERLT